MFEYIDVSDQRVFFNPITIKAEAAKRTWAEKLVDMYDVARLSPNPDKAYSLDPLDYGVKVLPQEILVKSETEAVFHSYRWQLQSARGKPFWVPQPIRVVLPEETFCEYVAVPRTRKRHQLLQLVLYVDVEDLEADSFVFLAPTFSVN